MPGPSASASSSLQKNTSGRSSLISASRLSAPKSSITDADDASIDTVMSRPMGPVDERAGGAGQWFTDQGVDRHVQAAQPVEPGRLRPVERRARSAVGEHRALARVVEQHDDRSRATAAPSHDIDPVGAHRFDQREAGVVGAHLADEPRTVAGAGDADGHVGRAAAAPPDDIGAGVGCLLHRALEADDDVFDEIADRADHSAAPAIGGTVVGCARVFPWTSANGSPTITKRSRRASTTRSVNTCRSSTGAMQGPAADRRSPGCCST